MTEAELEIESLKDSKKVIEEAEKWRIKLVLIGGYAVRAYTRGYRFTKDIDACMLKNPTMSFLTS